MYAVGFLGLVVGCSARANISHRSIEAGLRSSTIRILGRVNIGEIWARWWGHAAKGPSSYCKLNSCVGRTPYAFSSFRNLLTNFSEGLVTFGQLCLLQEVHHPVKRERMCW